MTLRELNGLDQAAFVAAVGWVFEHSPWVAERAWSWRPFRGVEELHRVMVAALMSASQDEQLALLRAHPDLGTRLAMTTASTGEQAGAGFDRLTVDQLERLRRLNSEYRERFGFPFLYAVKGATASQILQAIERRVTRTPQDEWAEALVQVARIARFRLERMNLQ
jgi:2-oxo-4-hydroxy-4-carboxy-5-ureidoimidazoline decarboxylase